MSTETKERPILMNARSVKGILSGQKTQTRRIMKPQPPEWCTEFGYTAFTPQSHISGRGRHEGEPSEGIDLPCGALPCLVTDISRPYACGFARSWDETNGKGAWQRNDWVWAVSFRRVEQ